MRCRRAASYVASFFKSSSRLFFFIFFFLLYDWGSHFMFVEGTRIGRSLTRNNNSNTRTSLLSVTALDEFSFRKALLQQNVGNIELEKDIVLNRRTWPNGTAVDPDSGISVQRNLTITSSASFGKHAKLYLDFMANRILIESNVTVQINGVVMTGVSKSARSFFGVPFFYTRDGGTFHIRNSQFQLAIDPENQVPLESVSSRLLTVAKPDGYYNWNTTTQTVSPGVCRANVLRDESCDDGGIFVSQIAARATLYNSNSEPNGKAAYLMENVLLLAMDVQRFPDVARRSIVEVSNSTELKSALENRKMKTIMITRNITIDQEVFNSRSAPIQVDRSIIIQSSPAIGERAVLQLNLVRNAVSVQSGVRLTLSNLEFSFVSDDMRDEERIPFFTSKPDTYQVFNNVVSELPFNPNTGTSLKQLPHTWFSVDLSDQFENATPDVHAVNSTWCREDGRTSCPDGALNIIRGIRRVVVTNGQGTTVGRWYVEMTNVLAKVIDVSNPRKIPTSADIVPARVEEDRRDDAAIRAESSLPGQTTASGTSAEPALGNAPGSSTNEGRRGMDPWILIYLLVATAVIMSICLLIVTFYRRKEQEKSVPTKESKNESFLPTAEDDGLREHQAIARQLLGDVKLGVLLGCGSFGRVYKATWSGAQVAVKVILHQEDEEEVTQEAMFSLSLRHPNVVQTYHYAVRMLDSCPTTDSRHQEQEEEEEAKEKKECTQSDPGGGKDHGMNIPSSWVKGSQGGQSVELSGAITTATMKSTQTATEASTHDDEDECWMEMWLIQEYCELGSVGRQNNLRFNSQNSVWGGRRELSAIIDTCRDIARGMKYLHDNGVVHGDLKCDNLLLQSCRASPKRFIAKVADFGLSRKIGCVTHLSTKSFGTITHMPPELLLEGHLSPKVDVYSFGVIMWELWSGDTPFRNMRYAEVMRAIVVDDHRPVFDEQAHPEFVALATLCWDKDPHRRPTFEEILDELDELSRILPNDDGGNTTDTSLGNTALMPSNGEGKS